MINQLIGDHSSNYMFLGFFIILIIFLLFWWIQRNERRKTLELEQRVSMLTQVVQDTAQNVNVLIERSERKQDVEPVEQTTQGTQVSEQDIEIQNGNEIQPETYKDVNYTISGEEFENEEPEDDSTDGNYSELDSLTDEEAVNDGCYNAERIEVSDIEEIQSVNQETETEKESTELKTINLEQSKPKTEQTNVDEELQKQYNKMTVKELRKIGEEKQIEQIDKMKKKTIVDLLSRVPVDSEKDVKTHE